MGITLIGENKMKIRLSKWYRYYATMAVCNDQRQREREILSDSTLLEHEKDKRIHDYQEITMSLLDMLYEEVIENENL